jgi:hypothetical protein
MHCKTEEEAKEFCKYLRNLKYPIYVGLPIWAISGVNVYYFNNDTWSAEIYARETGYTILEWEDFMKHTFTKADLKTGDVILRRSGDVEIVIKEHNVLLRPRECNRLADLNDDLTHSFLRDGDVIAVRRPNTPIDCQFGAFKDKRGTLIYERQEVEEMTLEQVCKLLGKEIKIIK